MNDLREEMLSRPLTIHRDFPTPTPTELFEHTLLERMPWKSRQSMGQHKMAPPGYHILYFPNILSRTASDLLPDGTDDLHSPGSPFTRRMWAGGALDFKGGLALSGQRSICKEQICDVAIKGSEGAEKVFVTIARLMGREAQQNREDCDSQKSEFAGGNAPLKETRTLVFMRDRAEMDAGEDASSVKNRKVAKSPDHFRVMTPTAQMLFRFSALTWNAHRIHLDKHYCQHVEGYRNLLVHGPLTVLLLLEVLKEYRAKLLRDYPGQTNEKIESVRYRNLAPLYAEEPMKICVKERRNDGSFDVWIEDKDGRLAVKGEVIMHGVIE